MKMTQSARGHGPFRPGPSTINSTTINHLASTNFDLIRPISTNKFFAEYKQIVRDFHNPPVIDFIRFIFGSIIRFPKTGVGDIHLWHGAMAPAAR